MTASETLTLSMKDYTTMQTDIAEARQEAATLRAELVAAKLVDPADRIKAQRAETFDGLLRAAQVAPGEHKVIFDFRPTSLVLGRAGCMIAMFYLVTVTWMDRRASRREGFIKEAA